MAENKKKWTLIDTIIVLVLVGACALAGILFGSNKTDDEDKGKTKTIQAVVLVSGCKPALAERIEVGKKVTINLAEKDTAKVKDVKIEPAQTMTYNSVIGEYINTYVEEHVDVYVTLEMKVEDTDYYLMTGKTKIKVGSKLQLRDKGYGTEGFVIEIKEGGKN